MSACHALEDEHEEQQAYEELVFSSLIIFTCLRVSVAYSNSYSNSVILLIVTLRVSVAYSKSYIHIPA